MDLQSYFKKNHKTAIAFSGGADSSFLLYAAVTAGAAVCAYYVKSAFQPQFELEDAVKIAAQLKVPIQILEADILSVPRVSENPPDRCYHCKKAIFSLILNAAKKDGFSIIADGTNASDDAGDRPGMVALKEMGVHSPLRECGLTKAEVRRLSKEAGLFTWNKPAYACLATRIPASTPITAEKLAKTEAAENHLFSLGFTDFRVRMSNEAAILQIPAGQIAEVMKNREAILKELKPLYGTVYLDMETRS